MKGDQDSGGIIHLFTRVLMLPMAALLSGIDVLIRTLQQVEDISKQGLEVVAGRKPDVRANPSPLVEQVQTSNVDLNDAGSKIEITHKEERLLTTNDNCGTELDKDLHDDMLKLVRYKVLFVRREYEVAFPEKEDLVSDNMDGAAFTAWKIAEFIQELQRRTTDVPSKWAGKDYPKNDPHSGTPFVEDGKLLGLPPEDKKYLRVYYEVLDRYPREKFKYEEQQIRVLEEIRNKLP
jgi:hypothetical protein